MRLGWVAGINSPELLRPDNRQHTTRREEDQDFRSYPLTATLRRRIGVVAINVMR
jgi:hypothetical protein